MRSTVKVGSASPNPSTLVTLVHVASFLVYACRIDERSLGVGTAVRDAGALASKKRPC